MDAVTGMVCIDGTAHFEHRSVPSADAKCAGSVHSLAVDFFLLAREALEALWGKLQTKTTREKDGTSIGRPRRFPC